MSPRFVLPALLLCGLASQALAQQAPLRDGKDKDLVEAACGLCHSLGYIPMNSPFLTKDVWKAEVTKMRAVFGAPIDDDAAGAIVAYLAAQYAAPPKQ